MGTLDSVIWPFLTAVVLVLSCGDPATGACPRGSIEATWVEEFFGDALVAEGCIDEEGRRTGDFRARRENALLVGAYRDGVAVGVWRHRLTHGADDWLDLWADGGRFPGLYGGPLTRKAWARHGSEGSLPPPRTPIGKVGRISLEMTLTTLCRECWAYIADLDRGGSLHLIGTAEQNLGPRCAQLSSEQRNRIFRLVDAVEWHTLDDAYVVSGSDLVMLAVSATGELSEKLVLIHGSRQGPKELIEIGEVFESLLPELVWRDCAE